MTAPTAQEPTARTRPRPRISRGFVLALGVVVIPIGLSAVANSYGPLTAESAWRMAAASVAGQTIAILSGVTAVVLTITRRYAWPAILAMLVIAAVITVTALSGMAAAGDLLMTRLDSVADVDLLNR